MDKKPFSELKKEWFTLEAFQKRQKQKNNQRCSFYDIIGKHIEEQGFDGKSIKKFSNATRLSSTICCRLKNDPTYRPSIETILAFSIGLRIPFDEIKDLLKLKKYALSPEDPVHCAYMDILQVYDFLEISVKEFNEILNGWGFGKDCFLGSSDFDEELKKI